MTQRIYQIRDIWLTIATLKSVIFFALLLYIFSLLGILLFNIGNESVMDYIKIFSLSYAGIFILYFLRVSIVFSKGHVVDLNKEEFRFPSTDIENSILDVITFKKYRDFARVKKIALKDISDIYIDTKKIKKFSSTTNNTTKIIYTINIVGPHGSNNLDFSSRQKRDEVRGVLVQAAKEVKVNVRDRKIAEFG